MASETPQPPQPPAVGDAGAISAEFVAQSTEAILADPRNVLARNAVTRTDVNQVLMRREVTNALNHNFSQKIPQEGKATSQHATGRCWLFAACNVMRQRVMARHNLGPDFELSQTFLYFYDKLEKANYLLENVLNTREEPVDGRLIQFLLQSPVQDGGQWDMVANIVLKYGVVPKSVYGEAASTKNSRRLNWFVTNKLREFARDLRAMMDAGASDAELQARKAEMMTVIHRVLVIHLGEPPATFTWSFHDKDKAFHQFGDLTPLAFYREQVAFPMDAMVSLVHDPRHEFGKTYTVDKLGNVVGGRDVLYLNVPMDDLLRYTTATLDSNHPVWFGCDVGKWFDRDLGVMDMDLFDFDLVYGDHPRMSKADRLNFGESLMTHAMVFTGYNRTVAGDVDKLRVENSWGDKLGDSGYHVMTRAWADEFLYQVVVDRNILTDEHQAALATEPEALPAWDPMGSLASAL